MRRCRRCGRPGGVCGGGAADRRCSEQRRRWQPLASWLILACGGASMIPTSRSHGALVFPSGPQGLGGLVQEAAVLVVFPVAGLGEVITGLLRLVRDGVLASTDGAA